MTSEQQASERLRPYANNKQSPTLASSKNIDAMWTITCAYLREHLPDDVEAIDEEFLRCVGFKDLHHDGDERLALKFDGLGDSQWIEVGPATYSHGLFMLRRFSDTMEDDLMPADIVSVKAKTRGDVRLLCAGLKITLTERPVA